MHRFLLRNYMMERFLERVTISDYREKFILKGGMLITSMVGFEARSTANTRMRDFYDIHILFTLYGKKIDQIILADALRATSLKRRSLSLLDNAEEVLTTLNDDKEILVLWNNYRSKFSYASDISWNDVLKTVRQLAFLAGLHVKTSKD